MTSCFLSSMEDVKQQKGNIKTGLKIWKQNI